jgi:hypothetical protein
MDQQITHHRQSRSWHTCGIQMHVGDTVSERMLKSVWQLQDDADDMMNAGMSIRVAIRKGLDVLPKLKRVVMMGEVDDRAVVRHARHPKSISDVFLSLPSVEYYCQSSGIGPLSMSNAIYKPLHPPRVATFHLSRSTMMWRSELLPPIVIGATNRYIWSGPGGAGALRVESTSPIPASSITSDMVKAMIAVVHTLCARTTVLEQLQPGPDTTYAEDFSYTQTVPFNSVSLNDTSIEIYNYVVNVIQTGPTVGSSLEKRPHVHPLSLDVCKAIERVLNCKIGRWRGKVIIRNGSDLQFALLVNMKARFRKIRSLSTNSLAPSRSRFRLEKGKKRVQSGHRLYVCPLGSCCPKS